MLLATVFLLHFDFPSLPNETFRTLLAGRATKHWEKARAAMKTVGITHQMQPIDIVDT